MKGSKKKASKQGWMAGRKQRRKIGLWDGLKGRRGGRQDGGRRKEAETKRKVFWPVPFVTAACGGRVWGQCCDLGYHSSLSRALRTYLSAELGLEASRRAGLEVLEGAVEGLDPARDRQRLLGLYPTAFCPPPRFSFQAHMGDTVGPKRRRSRRIQSSDVCGGLAGR